MTHPHEGVRAAAERPLPTQVAVLGAGTMGAGIAAVFARAGSHVVLYARRRSTLARARVRIRTVLARLESEPRAREVDARILTTRSLVRAARGAELVLESVVEDLTAKRDLLARAEELAPGALLATNTSSLRIGDLASALERPATFAGMHWFNPPELVDLVEVVPGPETAPETADALAALAESLGKVPILVRRDVPGFVANRLQYALLREAYALVEAEVVSYEDVDAAVRFGLGPRWAAVGPFESMDLAGLDVHHEVARRLFPMLANSDAPPARLARLVAEGSLGTKGGRGLRGRYDAAAIEALETRRTSILTALSRLERN
ncbi:MAG TPA: 3-hydroxyacyl-CoA dehydrogenase family protein [Gaiellaceae bacterium]|nr:3-hydroxyacyl-CoA dehydrogenase family protein [Gaiellaceae bacterium]